jgi:hypothetical protein
MMHQGEDETSVLSRVRIEFRNDKGMLLPDRIVIKATHFMSHK